MCLRVTVFLYIVVSAAKCDLSGEYFWRPWVPGAPPSDAISGRDHRGVSYIVEAYSPNYGLLIGQTFMNHHEINVATVHANNSIPVEKSHALKVLCSQNTSKLAWYPTDPSTLKKELSADVINPVIGGINTDDDDVLYIGRYIDFTSRAVIFGSICNVFNLHYYYDGKTYCETTNYEILVVKKNKCN